MLEWERNWMINFDGLHEPHTDADYPALRAAGVNPDELWDYDSVKRDFAAWLQEHPRETTRAWRFDRDSPAARGMPAALTTDQLSAPDLEALVLSSDDGSVTVRLTRGALDDPRDLLLFENRGLFEVVRSEPSCGPSRFNLAGDPPIQLVCRRWDSDRDGT